MIKMKKRKILSVLAAIAMAVTALPADFLSVYAESNVTEEYEEIIPDVQRDEELDSFSQPEYSPMFSFPDEVRGVYITPEKDFDIYDKNGDMLSEEDILAGINSALDSAENMSLNTVIINTSYNGNVYFSTDMNGITSRSELCAQAANELLDIVGIKASFILTQMGDTIYFSARSIDEINVQIIMERLGGGGTQKRRSSSM